MSAPPQPRPPSAQDRSSPHSRQPSPPPAERSPGPSTNGHHSPAPPPPGHAAYPYELPRGYPPGGYVYGPPPPGYVYPAPDDRYKHPGPATAGYAYPPPPPPFGHAPPHGYPVPVYAPPPPQSGSISAPPPPSNVQITYTDDAATKLSDRVRRKCFNCQTIETSTWRRSNMSAGKVLCNKCGLFERTHSRPRPEQFPHKRGPLGNSSPDASGRSPAPVPTSTAPPPPQQHYRPPPPPWSGTPSVAAEGAPVPASVSQPPTPDPASKTKTSPTTAPSQNGTRLPAVESWERDDANHGGASRKRARDLEEDGDKDGEKRQRPQANSEEKV
ncbi:hypothetical protein FB45DRAFT_935202 [Roridomyces roridus]|uniref:GATA-type domain-containing protein n=1 Tax=Roridomyces roridus TaxID=1738132 RepID=A0AAD7FCS1_9AGAR|nr:hypothetical protein FB45DRAFT_935202 [Roridomyces roridus]